MSLLLSEGHIHAASYPVAVVWSEAVIVRERGSNRRTRDAAVTQMVLSTLFSKKAGKQLKDLLEKVAESD